MTSWLFGRSCETDRTMPVKPTSKPDSARVRSTRRVKPPRHFADLSLEQRKLWLEELGQKGFRAKQISLHYFAHFTRVAAMMTDLPSEGRAELIDTVLPDLLTPERALTSDNGHTLKTVWRLFDGPRIESVVMRYPDRATLCLSSQAGCGMACPFCATGAMGLERNLSSAEIVEQARLAAATLASGSMTGGSGRLSNVVFMGMGEPLANYRAVVEAVRRLISPAPHGMNLSARNITISTCGLVPAMEQLTMESVPVTLALSLHAPDDERRDELVPVNSRWPVAQVLDAACHYHEVTGRRISIEYALIRDINDQGWRANLLGQLIAQRGTGWAHINLIPLNPTPGSRWTASRPGAQDEFVRRLRACGIATTIRDTRGRDIDGACGQLATSTGADGD